MHQDLKSAWMTLLTSQFRIPSSLMSRALMKKANIVLLPSLLTQVSSLHTSTWTVVRYTIGAVAVTPKILPSAMVSASGSSLDAAQFHSMWASLGTSSSATANSHQTLPSVMVLISTFWNGLLVTTEDSGEWLVLPPSGWVSHTGCSPSTSEQLET